MNANMKRTMLAMAVAALFATSMAYAHDDDDHLPPKPGTYKYEIDVTKNTDIDKNVDVNVNVNKNVNVNVRKEENDHSVDVAFKKKLALSTDVKITGDPTVSGNIKTDSAAIAVIDNRQSVSGDEGTNDNLKNTSSIGDEVASKASGNIGMNVAAGDNNAQDNAASLSAADASFSFGMADAEVFVNQNGSDNETWNKGVTNAAGIGGDAFKGATGNIGVNVTSGNNNEQKNALAASVAKTDYAQSSISSNQVSYDNTVHNTGTVERFDDTTKVTLRGPVTGESFGFGFGSYSGSSNGTYSGTTSSDSRGHDYQANNIYPDIWNGNFHPSGTQTGHFDLDGEDQGAVKNPYRGNDSLGQPIGGLAFDTDSHSTGRESGTTHSTESGRLGFEELSFSDLFASLSGSVVTSRYVIHDATNTATLSGNAFENASGNIGVNIAAGTGNLQANSLALAVAQPTATPPSTGGGGTEH